MKTITTLLATGLIIALISCKEKHTVKVEQETQQTSQSSNVQEVSDEKMNTNNIEEKKSTEKPMNLIDEQTKILTNVFGDIGGVEEFKGIDGYLELVEKMDASPEEKKYLTAQYELYSSSLDPEKEEEFKAKVEAMLQETVNQKQ